MLGITLCLLLHAAPAPAPARLRWDPRIDLPVVGVGLTVWLGSEFALKSPLAPKACRWCETNAFDTAVRQVFNPSLAPSGYGLSGADAASNVLLVVTPLGMLGLDAILAWQSGGLDGFAADATIIAEAALIAMCLNQGVKFAVGRARPYTVGATAEQLAVPGQSDHFLSFFSGHTTFVFAAVAATGAVATLRGYRLGWLSWAIGVPLATATGILRLAADKHWATDVITGLGVGFGLGLGIPLLFHGRENGPQVTLAPMPGGVALAGRF